jgi:Tfp pilus assembly protein PilF
MSKTLPIPMIALTLVIPVLGGCALRQPASSLQAAAAKVVRINPRSPWSWTEYGRACMFSANPSGAEMAFRYALELDEKYLPARLHLALLLTEQGRCKDAKKEYDRIHEIRKPDSEIATAYGYFLARSGNDAEAFQAFSRAIELGTDPVAVASARLGASSLLSKRGDHLAANRNLEEAVKADPAIGLMLEEQGRNRSIH